MQHVLRQGTGRRIWGKDRFSGRSWFSDASRQLPLLLGLPIRNLISPPISSWHACYKAWQSLRQ